MLGEITTNRDALDETLLSLSIYIEICICICICLYVCIYIYIYYVCMYLYIHVRQAMLGEITANRDALDEKLLAADAAIQVVPTP